MTLGGRYTIDKKRIDWRRLESDGSISFAGTPDEQRIRLNAQWKKFTPRVALKYDFESGAMLYGAFTRGFNSGGYAGRAPDASTVGPYDPENISAYEVGFKTELLDRTLRFNVAAFRTKYKDKQEEANVPLPVFPFFGTAVLNAADARLQGFEMEATAVPTPGLNFSFALGYLDAKYKNFVADITELGVTDNSQLKMRRTPKYTVAVGGDYSFAMGPGDMSVGARYRFIDAMELSVANDPNGHVKSGGYLDASLGYAFELGGADVKLSVYGRNLTDTVRQSVFFRTGGFIAFAAANRGREGGVEFTAKF